MFIRYNSTNKNWEYDSSGGSGAGPWLVLPLNFQSGIFEYGRTQPLGTWIDIPFNAANFTGSGAMTWTVESGDVVTLAYFLVGKTITVNMFIQSTSVGGTRDSYLMVNIPGFVSARNVDSLTKINDNGVQLGGLIRIFAGESLIRFHKVDSTAWNLSTNGTSVFCQFSYPLV